MKFRSRRAVFLTATVPRFSGLSLEVALLLYMGLQFDSFTAENFAPLRGVFMFEIAKHKDL